jgi:hypothetical protein
MVRVVVTCDVIVDLVDAVRLEIRDRFLANALSSIIKEDRFSHWRDQQCTITLTNIDKVELKASIGLAEQRTAQKKTEAQKQMQSPEHRTSRWVRNLLGPA